MVFYAAGIIVPPKLREVIDELGKMYFDRTKKTLTCTSGLRDSFRQAGAMYDNYMANRGVQYARIDLEKEIKAVYDELLPKPNHPKTVIVRQMADVINDQINRGEYLSQHLVGNAADFSLEGLDVNNFMACALDQGGKPYKEVHCMHNTFKL